MRNGTVAVVVEDSSQVGEARRLAMRVAADAGFDESARSDIGIVATEAATNVVRHGHRGEVLITEVDSRTGPGLELVCVDQGPGMPDVGAAMRDGFSSKGTMGGGFGAMRRLSDDFQIYSAPGVGTALVCRFWPAGASPNGSGVLWAGLAVPVRGESACGDAWAVLHGAFGTALLLADGLGHGAPAAEAAAEAVRIFRAQTSFQPEQVLAVLHAGLRSTRGAAAAVALIDAGRREIRYAGIGNISATILTGDGTRSLVSHNGTLGFQVRKTQEFVYPWSSGSLLVAHSDGLGTHWKLEQYPGLYRQDPALVAALLYRDHARRRDDTSVVVGRLLETPA
jgi:anti-sigma regulatory factor (Ser/Thr protein kinase)